MDIIWLDQPGHADVSLVGGKAANLSRLAAHYSVPLGFCVTSAALHLWTGHADTEQARVYSEIIDEALRRAYHTLEERCSMPNIPVAVRSSGVEEDGLVASFAGQYETYLNVVGAESVAEAVRCCWSSAQSSRVKAYQRQRNVGQHPIRIAVLVQQLIKADTSAVVFSTNPTDGNREVITIDVTWGLGESLVSGTVTPDHYVVRKADMEIIQRVTAHKLSMTVLMAEGTKEVPVPRIMQRQPAVSDTQVIEMAQLALSLEAETKWPVDIECGYQEDNLFLLQCRPITTIEANRV